MPIAVEQIGYTYNPGGPFQTEALRNISFSVEDGEFIGIMGRTGCGKSTLLQILSGLLCPAEGAVYLDHENINSAGFDRNDLRRAVGVVFQYPERQLFESTVFKDVAFGLKHLKLPREEMKRRVCRSLQLTGFDYEEVCGKSPLELSGGEKRRVAIAGVLALNPRILILDEPIAGLDPSGRERFMELLSGLNRQGTTIFMISHNSDYISAYCRRVIILEKGRLLMDGSTEKVFSRGEVLKAAGIHPGQCAEIADMMKKRGIELPENLLSYQQLKDAIVKKWKETTDR